MPPAPHLCTQTQLLQMSQTPTTMQTCCPRREEGPEVQASQQTPLWRQFLHQPGRGMRDRLAARGVCQAHSMWKFWGQRLNWHHSSDNTLSRKYSVYCRARSKESSLNLPQGCSLHRPVWNFLVSTQEVISGPSPSPGEEEAICMGDAWPSSKRR